MPEETVSSLIQSITVRLGAAGIEDAGIDARFLVRSAFGWSAADQLGQLLDQPPSDQLDHLESLVARRTTREPLQYITGRAEFYRRQFIVNENVLIPRPETEQIVVQVLAFVREAGIDNPRIADICTGSGAIAISLALELPAAEVHATDISSAALTVAQQNTDALAAELDMYEGNLLEPLTGEFDVIVSNPPYILSGAMPSLQAEVSREPSLALDGGNDGLDVVRPLFEGIATMLKPTRSAAYVEIDPPVADDVLQLALDTFPQAGIALLTDLDGLTRCVSIEYA
ncbi:MAG TPA: peptide chain release factor N(5)-glutamine methyltransferase [Dehalococcoidia bacterium]|jgi:release factor glutamine methyltransferase|nr:peptide chain release factor N(5)-glutamine methyltransferase [Dehalococcoidia bacterium]MDP7090542.1 peptide chain release factor N(5)-glutamine methyltransferase [Dehalococcoidia bacterium]MDP7261009.1 peptide chain release factor N(5)-glutamine methyltransferase [Dehalococcoidia bacterium]HJP27469.1 peptide chain release factor N(5)-glutamine methyltransferase [Dehalococcoidia bacterium]|tara:strand:- start:698 stop:1552 length:855 start_codon:yes stop_codon:yes gene_type:complete